MQSAFANNKFLSALMKTTKPKSWFSALKAPVLRQIQDENDIKSMVVSKRFSSGVLSSTPTKMTVGQTKLAAAKAKLFWYRKKQEVVPKKYEFWVQFMRLQSEESKARCKKRVIEMVNIMDEPDEEYRDDLLTGYCNTVFRTAEADLRKKEAKAQRKKGYKGTLREGLKPFADRFAVTTARYVSTYLTF
jgi:hypothetical protein